MRISLLQILLLGFFKTFPINIENLANTILWATYLFC